MNKFSFRRFVNFYLSVKGLPLINGSFALVFGLITMPPIIAIVFAGFALIPAITAALMIRWFNSHTSKENIRNV